MPAIHDSQRSAMRLLHVLLLTFFVGCNQFELPESFTDVSSNDKTQLPKELAPSLIDSPIVLDGWLRRKQKGWPTELECVGMDVVLTFPASTTTETLDSFDGKHVRVKGYLRSQDVRASLGQQGQSGKAHLRYYVEVSDYEVVVDPGRKE